MLTLPCRMGCYELIALLGMGGMAEVYLARTSGPCPRLVAIKMLRDHLADDPQHVKMFLDEARLGGLLKHPNTAPAYEMGRHGDRWFLVMDFVPGETLSRILTRGRIPAAVALRVIIDVAEGLHALHELTDRSGRPLGVVHRDVSPMNMVVGYDGRARVIDFGICKSSGERRHSSSPGVQKGKHAYMSPEQIYAQPVDRRTDVFALGIVLWEAISGMRLFKTEDMAATIDRILTMRVPYPSTLVRDCPPEVDAIVERALSRDKERRFSTMLEMLHAAEAALHRIAPSGARATVERLMDELFPERMPAAIDPMSEVTVRVEPPRLAAV